MRTVAQLVDLLTRHGVELRGTPEGAISRWLRSLPESTEDADEHRLFEVEIGTLGIYVSARYDWDMGSFVVRDWWTFNA